MGRGPSLSWAYFETMTGRLRVIRFTMTSKAIMIWVYSNSPLPLVQHLPPASTSTTPP